MITVGKNILGIWNFSETSGKWNEIWARRDRIKMLMDAGHGNILDFSRDNCKLTPFICQ